MSQQSFCFPLFGIRHDGLERVSYAAHFIESFEQVKLAGHDSYAHARCTFSCEAYRAEDFYELGISCPSAISQSVPSRQAEFLAGRLCAQFCLQRIGVSGDAIGIGPDRAPIWPEGVVGSISHAGRFAECMVAKKSSVQFIGIDVESVLPRAKCVEIADHVLSTEEFKIFEKGVCGPVSFEQYVTLLFSAKEAVFKALYPMVNEYFGFLDVELIAAGLNSLTLKLDQQLADRFGVNHHIKVSYELDRGLARTQCTKST